MTLNGLNFTAVPLRIYSLTHCSWSCLLFTNRLRGNAGVLRTMFVLKSRWQMTRIVLILFHADLPSVWTRTVQFLSVRVYCS